MPNTSCYGFLKCVELLLFSFNNLGLFLIILIFELFEIWTNKALSLWIIEMDSSCDFY